MGEEAQNFDAKNFADQFAKNLATVAKESNSDAIPAIAKAAKDDTSDGSTSQQLQDAVKNLLNPPDGVSLLETVAAAQTSAKEANKAVYEKLNQPNIDAIPNIPKDEIPATRLVKAMLEAVGVPATIAKTVAEDPSVQSALTEPEPQGGLATGALVGIIAGAVVGLGIIIAIAFTCCKKKGAN